MHSDLGLTLVKVLSWSLPGAPWAELKRFHISQAFQSYFLPPCLLTTKKSWV